MRQNANTYMQKIGFEGQPYLVYKHHDTAIPHMHIVSTIVQPDGERIKTHNMGKLQSMKARDEIEIAFNLEKAENPAPGEPAFAWLKNTLEIIPAHPINSIKELLPHYRR